MRLISLLSLDTSALGLTLNLGVGEALLARHLLLPLRQLRPHLLDLHALLRLVECPHHHALCRQLFLFVNNCLRWLRERAALRFFKAEGVG